MIPRRTKWKVFILLSRILWLITLWMIRITQRIGLNSFINPISQIKGKTFLIKMMIVTSMKEIQKMRKKTSTKGIFKIMTWISNKVKSLEITCTNLLVIWNKLSINHIMIINPQPVQIDKKVMINTSITSSNHLKNLILSTNIIKLMNSKTCWSSKLIKRSHFKIIQNLMKK